MNVELLMVIIVVTVCFGVVFNRDLFAPPLIVGIIFSIIIYLSLFINKKWELYIHANTFKVIVIGILFIGIGCTVSRIPFLLNRQSSYNFLNSIITPIKIYELTLIRCCSICIFIISAFSIMNVARKILGNGGISNLIYAYRVNLLSGNNLLPSIVSNLILLNYAIGYLCIYVLINNWFATNKVNKSLLVPIILPSITGLLQGARGNLIQYFLFAITVFYYFYMIVKKKRNVDIKLLIKIVAVTAVVIYAFYILRIVLGRNNDSLFLDYIGGLLCAPIKLLDTYIQENHAISETWGLETFTNLISMINRWRGLPGIKYSDYANYRIINNISMGNVYTAFRAYYSDFNLVGVATCSFLIGVISGIPYNRFRSSVNRKNKINYALFLYAYFVYGLAMMFYSNTFYEYIVNISFLKMLIVWYLLDLFFVKRRIKVKV